MLKTVLNKFIGRRLINMAGFATSASNGKLKGKVAIVTASTDG
jgi:hypothetical protein